MDDLRGNDATLEHGWCSMVSGALAELDSALAEAELCLSRMSKL